MHETRLILAISTWNACDLLSLYYNDVNGFAGLLDVRKWDRVSLEFGQGRWPPILGFYPGSLIRFPSGKILELRGMPRNRRHQIRVDAWIGDLWYRHQAPKWVIQLKELPVTDSSGESSPGLGQAGPAPIQSC